MSKVDHLVAVSTYGRGGASSRVRMHDWFAHTGVRADVHDYLGSGNNQLSTLLPAAPRVVKAELGLRRLSRNLSGKTVLMSKQASPFSSGGIEASLLRNASLSVYDFDDALFSDVAGWTRRLWSKRELWSRSVKTADVVIAGSDYLAAEASKLSGNVVMIPSCVEPNSYTQKSDYERSETPRAVWIGSPATERFLTMLTRPLVALHERFGLRVSVISAGASSLGALDPIIDRVQWSIEGFPEHLANADFGIMPLPDTPFTRGKCSYKLLQYAAAGLPLIGSPVGANERVLQTMGGLVATDLADWFDAVASILEMTSPQRAAMGAATHDAVTKHYSYSAWETTWKRALSLG